MRTQTLAMIGMTLFSGMLGGNAHAQGTYELTALKPGQVMLHISATEQQEVAQDMLVASLEYSVEGKDKSTLQDGVNRTMQKAVALLDKAGAITFSTQHYQVYQLHQPRDKQDIEPESKTPLWRAQQGIQLKGTDGTAVLDYVGKLQEMGLHMKGLSYQLSPARQAEITDSMLTTVLHTLQKRADRAAEALGKKSADLVEVNVQGGGDAPMLHRSMMAMESAPASQKMATPVARPGQSTVSLSVDARALLIE